MADDTMTTTTTTTDDEPPTASEGFAGGSEVSDGDRTSAFDDDDDDGDDGEDDDEAEESHRAFLALIRQCRAADVRRFLEDRPAFDVNRKDYRGTTGLTAAVEANCAGTVDALLAHPRLDVGDGLMHAVRYGHHAIAVRLLDVLEARDPAAARAGCADSAEFPEHLTPLMLAAQCGHVRVITTLLRRGHTIAVPHKARCLCKEVCKSSKRLDDGLGAAELKISAFRALTNPAYIALTSEDPILTAFRLSNELREHAVVDRVFRADYETLDTQARLFAVHLVGLCRSSAEVDAVLTRRDGCTFFGAFPYHRLVLAMDLRQKEFVAHAHVQQALQLSWTGDWYRWRRRGVAYQAAAAAARVPLLPYVALLFLAFPRSRPGRHYALPVNRMLNYVASYAVFLAALSCENNSAKAGGGGGAERDSGDWPAGVRPLRCVVFVYALSYAYRTVKLALVQGPRRYFGMLWNAYDCATLATLAAAFACWWLAYRDGPAADPVTGAPLPRERWPAADPRLVAEALLAVATVMAWLRALFLCQLSYALGPLQVSLGKMTTDFARFALLFGIVLLAFTAGLCTLYQYYAGMARTDPATGRESRQDDSFVGVAATLRTLFWGLFCMAPATAGTVVVEAAVAADDRAEETAAGGHYFTQAVGTALYAAFMVLAVVMMMNMLVASMTNTYQRVTGNAYVEWVFGRTKVYLSFAAHTELPPPMNLVPHADCALELCGCCLGRAGAGRLAARLVVSSDGRRGHQNQQHGGHQNQQHGGQQHDTFRALMAVLVRRYFRDRLSGGFDRRCAPVCG